MAADAGSVTGHIGLAALLAWLLAACRCDEGPRNAVVLLDSAGDEVVAGDGACAEPAIGCQNIRVLEARDGDSLRVMVNGAATLVRLAGIDAPELGQVHGVEARAALNALTRERRIRWRGDAKDKFGRHIGFISLEGDDGPGLNVRMVELGHAWHYRQFSDDPVLASAETAARAAGRGLWAHADPMPPWEYRRGEGREHAERGDVPLDADAEVIGNARTLKYHLRNCPGFLKVGARNRIFFATPAEAEAAGFTRAANCP